MPNWCSNNLLICGTKEKIKEIERVINNFYEFYYEKEVCEKDGHKVLRKPNGDPMGLLYYCKPEPDYTVTPVPKTFPEVTAKYAKTEEEREKIMKNEPTIRKDSWWDWRVQNWGCKWEINAEIANVDDESISIYFDSPWGPPIEAYDALLKHDGIESIEANYYESGCAFGGVHTDGKHEHFNVEDLTAEDFKSNEVVKEVDECHYIFSDIMLNNPLKLRPELANVMKGLGIEDCWDVAWQNVVKIYETLKDKPITPSSIEIVTKGDSLWPTHFTFNNEEYNL